VTARRLLPPALLLLTACSTQERVRLIGETASTRSEGSVTTSDSLTADLSADRQLSTIWDLRVSDRSRLAKQSTEVDGVPGIDSTTTTHQPRVLLSGAGGLWQADLIAERTQSDRNSQGGTSTGSHRDNLYTRLVYQPDNLPTLTLQADRSETVVDGFGSAAETRRFTRVEHTIDTVSAYYEHYNRLQTYTYQAEEQEFWEDRLGILGNFENDAGTVSGNASLSWTKSTTESRGPAVDVGQLVLVDGLYALDSTPSLGALDPRTALNDGNRDAGAGIPIGGVASGGGVDRNLGIDQGVAPKSVERIHVYTDVAFTPAEAAEFSWSVFTSNDNLIWTRTEFSALTTYDQALRRFVIQTGDVASRYVKVVNRTYSATAPAVEVTEIVALGAEGSIRDGVTTRRTTADASLLLTPAEDVRVDFQASVGALVQEENGVETSTEDLRRLSLGASYAPLDWLSASARTSRDEIDNSQYYDLRRLSFFESLGFVLNPNWRLDLTAVQMDEEADDLPRLESESVSARSTATFVHDIVGTVAATNSQSRDLQADRDTDSNALSISAHAPLRQDMDARADIQKSTVRSVEAGERIDFDTTQVGLGVTWFPNTSFSMRVDLDWMPESVGPTGVSQAYQVNWQPLSGGQLEIQLNLNRREGSSVTGVSQNSLARVRWRLRHNAFLDLTSVWSEQSSATGDTTRAQSTALLLNIDF
jgi:hypothetical protein